MTKPTFDFEKELWNKGFSYVIGLDEVGRGAFAGPVVVGAVVFDLSILNLQHILSDVNDSKLLTPKTREVVSPLIKKYCNAWTIQQVSVSIINKIGIGKATHIAFRKAIQKLYKPSCHVLVDGKFKIPNITKHQTAIVKGDQKCMSISAASIIAKVFRDDLMNQSSKSYPEYGFTQHKGYGTKQHRDALSLYGLSKIHRTSFQIQKYT